MKFGLNKKKLKNLSRDNASLPIQVTPQVAGASALDQCVTETVTCQTTVGRRTFACDTDTIFTDPTIIGTTTGTVTGPVTGTGTGPSFTG